MTNKILENYPRTYSFLSYKGGAGRTSLLVNVAEALILQGVNVLIIDLDLEGSGIPIFSSTENPDPLFQPMYLYCLGETNETLYQKWEESSDDNSIPLPGLLNIFDKIPQKKDDVEKGLNKLPIYECRSPYRHPLEGRLFVVPSGGRFEVEKTEGSTPCTYHPIGDVKGDKKELKSVMNSEWMLSENLSFFELLKNKANELCNKNNVEIDYILVDLKPGMSSRSLIASTATDGLILVASGSRGNLAGVKDYIEALAQFIAPQEPVESTFPPIVGLAISPLLTLLQGDGKGGAEDFSETLFSHTKQLNLSTFLEELRNKNIIQTPNQSDTFKYTVLNHEIFSIPQQYENLKRSIIKSISTIWGAMPDEYEEEKSFLEIFFPIMLDPMTYMHDRIFDTRGYSKNPLIPPKYDDPTNIYPIILLAGHLREKNRGNDITFRAWELWYKEAFTEEDVKENDWESIICQKPLPFRVSWYYAQWLEKKQQYSKALEYYSNADSQLQKNYDEMRDWRILLKRGRLYRVEAKQKNEEKQRKRLNRLSENDFKKALEYIDKERDIDNDEDKDDYLAQTYSDIHQEIADNMMEDNEYEKAWSSYKESMENNLRPNNLIKDLVNSFFPLYCNVKVKISVLEKIYETIFEYIVNSKRQGVRDTNLLLSETKLRLIWYWKYICQQATEEKIKYLEEIASLLKMLIEFREEGIWIGSNISGVMAEVRLELSILNKKNDLLSDIDLKDALALFIEAMQFEPENIRYHIYLSIVRCLYVDILKKEKLPGEMNEEVHREISIIERDAFYSFEQAWALYFDKDFYFEDEEVQSLNIFLPTHLDRLSEKSLKEDEKILVNWFSHFEDENQLKNIEYYNSLIKKYKFNEIV